MQAIGQVLIHAAAQDPRAFVEHVWTHIARTRANDLMGLRRAIASFHGRPPWWGADAGAMADNLRYALEHPSLAHPHDLTRVYGADAAMRELQEQTRRYGELLVAWPALWEAAGRLAERGIRVAAPLTSGNA